MLSSLTSCSVTREAQWKVLRHWGAVGFILVVRFDDNKIIKDCFPFLACWLPFSSDLLVAPQVQHVNLRRECCSHLLRFTQSETIFSLGLRNPVRCWSDPPWRRSQASCFTCQNRRDAWREASEAFYCWSGPRPKNLTLQKVRHQSGKHGLGLRLECLNRQKFILTTLDMDQQGISLTVTTWRVQACFNGAEAVTFAPDVVFYLLYCCLDCCVSCFDSDI